jgi:hypothetical protein
MVFNKKYLNFNKLKVCLVCMTTAGGSSAEQPPLLPVWVPMAVTATAARGTYRTWQTKEMNWAFNLFSGKPESYSGSLALSCPPFFLYAACRRSKRRA